MMSKGIFVLKSCILYFILFLHFSILVILLSFLIKEIRNVKTVNNMSTREQTL